MEASSSSATPSARHTFTSPPSTTISNTNSSSSFLSSPSRLYKAKQVQIRDGRVVSFLHLPKAGSELTVFLVHGACAGWRQYARLIPTLSARYSVVTWDVYGCGESPKPEKREAYSTEELLLDMIAIYRQYAGAKNLLVGHSFGSSQVMRLADCIEKVEDDELNQKHQLLGMVLLSSAYHVQDGGHPIFALPMPVLSLIQPLISQAFKTKAIDSHADPSILEDNARVNKGNPTHMVKAFYQQLRWVPKEIIHHLQTPSIIIHGETDGIIPLHQGRRLAAALALCRNFYVFRQTGHQVMQERPLEVLEQIQYFIDYLLLPSPSSPSPARRGEGTSTSKEQEKEEETRKDDADAVGALVRASI